MVEPPHLVVGNNSMGGDLEAYLGKAYFMKLGPKRLKFVDRFPTHVTHQVGGLDHGFRAPCFVRSLASYFFIF